MTSTLLSCTQVVYVAPMKALAAEVTANFSRRLQPLGRSGAFSFLHVGPSLMCCAWHHIW
jgi:replicative superfamily II helicase